MPTYRSILKKSFRFTAKHKRLWFVGFWVALFGNGGEYEIFFKNLTRVLDGTFPLAKTPDLFIQSFIGENFFTHLQNLIRSLNPLINLGLILIFVCLAYLGITAQGVLIKSVYDSGKLKRKPRVKETWIKTRAKFFDLLLATALFKGGGFILALLFSLPFVLLLQAFTTLAFEASVLIVGFMLFTPLAICVSFLAKYMVIFIMIKNYDPFTAFTASIKLFKDHWLLTIENALILFICNVALSFAALLCAVILSFPIIALVAVIVYPQALPEGHYIAIIAWTSIILLPVLGSALATFQTSAWTILWTKITGMHKIQSKLARIVGGILPKAI